MDTGPRKQRCAIHPTPGAASSTISSTTGSSSTGCSSRLFLARPMVAVRWFPCLLVVLLWPNSVEKAKANAQRFGAFVVEVARVLHGLREFGPLFSTSLLCVRL
eukprot:m.316978 g.316978  ORF g.316978 m.316978 type:complete len:104 (+) comp19682_c1_seq3:427-738(+)